MRRPGTLRTRVAAGWDSPVLMTWGSLAVRLGGVAVVWPLALRTFSAPEVVIWQVFATLTALVVAADFGLGPVLMRFAAARGGVLPGEGERGGDDDPVARLRRLAYVGERLYGRLMWCAAAAVLAPVTAVVYRRVGELEPELVAGAWLGWAAAAAAFLILLRAGGRSALLQGAGQVARVRRTEMVIGGVGVAATAAGLVLFGGLASVSLIMLAVAVTQAACWRRWLRRELGGAEGGGDTGPLMRAVWKGAWRSGAGLVCSAGVAHAASLMVAAFAGSVEAAAYLIGWRLLSVASQFSQAPFYGRLPEFGGLAAAGKTGELLAQVRRAMAMSLGLFVVGALVLNAAGPWLLEAAGADVVWPSRTMWAVMGLALFLERYGAMHLQLHTLGHDVRWHIAGGGTALVSVGVMVACMGSCGLLAVPMGMLAGQVLFYCPYAVSLSKRRYRWSWREFDWPATVWLGVLVAGLFWARR